MISSEHHSLLAIRGLEKNFGALRAIDDLHLDVASGGIFGIIGPNGSGKTTLFNVISGVYKPAAGTVHYRGRDLTGLPSDRVARRGIARTFQNLKIFRRLTVLENVLGAQTGSTAVSFLQAAFPHPSLERGRRGQWDGSHVGGERPTASVVSQRNATGRTIGGSAKARDCRCNPEGRDRAGQSTL